MISTSADRAGESDTETARGSSEASVEIITELDPFQHSSGKSTSPRKPLPAQWLPAAMPPDHTTTRRSRLPDDKMSSTCVSLSEHRSSRAPHGSLDVGKVHTKGASFLTKEALDAVNANITSPTLRRSPSKIQNSPAKVPWNSPAVSPKVGGLRQSAGSPTKPSPPRINHLNTHAAANHKRAPSSIVSTGATSFHTARGSPVRSPALSQSSFSSNEIIDDNMHDRFFNGMANDETKQVEDGTRRLKLSMLRAETGLQTRAPKPELSISIPLPDSAMDVERESASTLASTTSSTGASSFQGNSPGSSSLSSRIPRKSIGKGSSARAPTLSSTLKQTKSTQTLRSPKAPKRAAEADRSIVSRPAGARSLRHVRTVDSSGATPILPSRNDCDSSIPTSNVSVTTMVTGHTAQTDGFGQLSTYLQDTAMDTGRDVQSAHSLNTYSATSRAASKSTVRTPRAVSYTSAKDSTVICSRREADDSGKRSSQIKYLFCGRS